MWYLFAEKRGHDTILIEDTDNTEILRAKARYDAEGWTTTVLDEAERQRYRHLTAQLIEDHPDLAR